MIPWTVTAIRLIDHDNDETRPKQTLITGNNIIQKTTRKFTDGSESQTQALSFN